MADGQTKRILIVDDEPGMRDLLRDFLSGYDYEIFEAPDGRAAIEILERESIDLAIVDIFMPDVDGLELLSEFNTRAWATKVIAISGGGASRSGELPLRMAELLGAKATLEKPFDLQVLLDEVERCLEG